MKYTRRAGTCNRWRENDRERHKKRKRTFHAMVTSKHSDSTAEKPNAKWYGSAASASGADRRPSANPPRDAIPCPAEIASTMADVPKLAQAWRTAIDSELPCGTSGRGRSARLHWVSGPMSSDTPHARTPWNTTACHNGEAASKKHMGTAPAESISPPTRQTRRAPKRSVNTPPSGLRTSAATVPGSSTMPA